MPRALSAQLEQEERTASLCNQIHTRSALARELKSLRFKWFPRCSHMGRPADPPARPLSRGCWCRIGPQRRLRLWTQQDTWGLSLLFSETRRDGPVIAASLSRDANRARRVQDSGAGRNKGIGTLSLSAASAPSPCHLSVCLSCTLALGGLGALVTRCHWAETPRVGHKATFPSSQRYRSPGGPSPGSHVHSLYWEHFGARGSTGHVEREDAWPPNRQCPRRCPVPKGATPGSCPRPPCSPARHLHHGVRKQRRRGSQLAPCISPTPAWSQSYLDGEEVLHFHRPSLSGCADQLDGARLPSQTVGCLTAGSAKPHASPQP